MYIEDCLDSFSNHKTLTRFILAKKLASIKNIFHIPNILNIVYKFRLYKLDNLNDVQIYNYVYLFKFFMGRRSLLTKYKSYFNLGIWTYSLNICMYVTNNRNKYNNFYIYLHYYIFVTDSLFYSNYSINKNMNVFLLCLRDTSVLTDRKTNLGLFYILSNLYLFARLRGPSHTITFLTNNIKLKEIK